MARDIQRRARERRRNVALTLVLLVLAALLWPFALAHAQAPRIVALDAAQPAPFEGMLVADDDLVRWRQEIERLRVELELAAMRYAALVEARTADHDALTAANDDRLRVVEELWRARAEELRTAAETARSELVTSKAREGPRWFQRPGLWFVIGAAATCGVAIAVSAAK